MAENNPLGNTSLTVSDSFRSTFEETCTLTSELDVEPEAAIAAMALLPAELPWGASRERPHFPASVYISTGAKPGEFVLQTLFAEFTVLAEKKIQQVLDEANRDKLISKSLQRGEDPNFDQVLTSLSSVAENCLPSLLCTLFEWYSRQNPDDGLGSTQRPGSKNKGEKEYHSERRDLAVDFLYCLVLIEVLKQLPFHPGHDDLIQHVINQAFRHFKFKEGVQSSPNGMTVNAIADLYAEVIGVLALSRFPAVRKRFLTELKELRSRDQNTLTTQNIISLLMGMKFFRVKMHPIEEFQASVQFLHEVSSYFMEVKDKDIKHALAGLFVEILLPVAAVVKNEVNVPVLKNFVEMMYMPTYDLAIKKKHILALTPLVTCLLCVSQKQFFLNNWPSFLGFCLSKLKDKEPKMARVALESLYRLLWVYMIRVKCESNATTTSRLQSIVQSLFPKGTKTIMPKDTPLNIFVKIIQFIAQERLDFAMREIIFDLLCVGKPAKIFSPVSPERMSIGLRAFLVIADSLQQKDGDPPMPQTVSSLPSGNTLRFKKTFISKYLSEETARMIGMVGYYAHVRKAFDAILKQLDQQVGKPLLMCKTENINREPDEMITGDRKPKIDLFRICVAAVPRLLPEGMMTRQELIGMQCRLTVHVDDELGRLAFQSLQNLVVDLPEWRNDVLCGFVQFIEKEVGDSFSQLLDQCNRRLIQLLTQWKTVAQISQAAKEKAERGLADKAERPEASAELNKQTVAPSPEQLANRSTLQELEGYALVMLCSCKPTIRKQAVHILKEARHLFALLNVAKDGEPCVLDIMDQACPPVIERVLPHLPLPEKVAALSATPVVDFQWLADRTSIIWQSGGAYHNLADTDPTPSTFDPWIECMCIFMRPDFVVGRCVAAVNHAWPTLFARLQSLYTHHVDPNLPSNEGRTSSILRGSRRLASERDMYMSLWKNYLVMACCLAPPHYAHEPRSLSPDLNSSPEATTPDKTDTSKLPTAQQTSRDLFKLLVPLVKCDLYDMRESIVTGLAHTHPAAFRCAVEEMLPLIKDAIDRKQENVKRKRKRDVLRLVLVRIFHYMAENGIFAQSLTDVLDPATDSLCSTFVEYIDGARQYLEAEADKESDMLQQIRLHFTDFIRHLIRNTPVSRRYKFLSHDLRRNLFNLLDRWSGHLGLHQRITDNRSTASTGFSTLEQSSVQAMSAVLCCGPAFDSKELNDENNTVYTWLSTLLANTNEQIYKLAQETIVLMLEFNPDAQALLDWVIDKCYTGSHAVSDGCFNALARVFSNREYPCDHVAMLNVTLLYTGCPRIATQETAVQLLHLLYKRFFLDDVVITDQDVIMEEDDEEEGAILRHNEEEKKKALQEMLLSGPYSRTQLYLSQTLAKLHPKQLTMPMYSEVTQRFQTAIPAVRQLLLQYLLPWLYNLELLDPNLPPPRDCLGNMFADYVKPPLQGEGWGSPEATEMVLNNLFYITAMFGDDHAKEIEDLWASLVTFWPGNLQVIARYLIILSGMAPSVMLPHAKRVVVYLGRAKPERLVDEMMNELRTTEPLTFNVERTPTPPFFRLTSLKKQPAAACDDLIEGAHSSQLLDKGQIHTKRHSGEEQTKHLSTDDTPRTSSVQSLRSETSSVSSVSTKVPNEGEEMPASPSLDTYSTVFNSISPVPFPLPMPAFGGYFSPLSELLPDAALPNPPYQRCNLAAMLLTDLVEDCMYIDWTVHLPLMLHVIFLGLDHTRVLIHEHCRRLLLNLLIVLSQHDHFSIAQILLSSKGGNDNTSLTLPSTNSNNSFLDGSCESTAGIASLATLPCTGRQDSLTPDTVSSLPPLEVYESGEQVARALIEFIVTRKCRPLWSYEDITSKVHNIHSVEQLDHFLKYVLKVFKDSQPLAHTEQRWAQEALHLALSCSSRHYAGRSFQIFRALHVPLTSSDLSDILSRLVETVAEQGEDMQGYVTEIMLTLEAAVDNLDVDVRPLMRELFMSTPNLNKEARNEMRKSATITPLRPNVPHHSTHYRSTSFRDNLSLLMRRAIISPSAITDNKEPRHQRHSSGDTDMVKKRDTNLKRSTSAHSLKHLQDPTGHDDKLTILSQMFWIAVSLLESDFEYEFLLAVRLLDKILKHIQPDRPECKEKLDKILQQINWMRFPGVQALLLKGCTSAVTAESTWSLLTKLTLCLTAPVIDPSQCSGFPMNVIALLPQLVEHYEEPNKTCTEAADHIAQMCGEQSQKLDNLATVMTLYSRGTFGKDSFQWTKCVVKYLYDVCSGMSDSLISFLVEVLEKGPSSLQTPLLQILHCIVHYIDLVGSPSQAINSDLLRVVTKYIESTHWKEALKILKLCVTRSSTLSAAPPTISTYSTPLLDSTILSLASHTSFAEAEITVKKELPGRTMDFQFDMSQIPVIKHRRGGGDQSFQDKEKPEREGAANHPPQIAIDITLADWKKPHLSQERTRKRLRNLLTCYGHTVLVPASPSVIFSQESPSDTLARQTSVGTSSEETSLVDGLPGDMNMMKMRDDSSGEQNEALSAFDFLDDPDPVTDMFWGVKRPSPEVEEEEGPFSNKEEQVADSSDDESPSGSPVDELHQHLPCLPTITLQNTTNLTETTDRTSMSGSMHSIHSACSDLDTTLDLSPSTSSPSFSNMVYVSIPSDEVEDLWSQHVNQVMTDHTGLQAVGTFHLFARLFHESRRRVYSLTKEACYYLCKTDNVRHLAAQLSNLLEVTVSEIECPLVYVDSDALLSCQLLQRHKLTVQEIDESFETFIMRREQAVEYLETLKSPSKDTHMEEHKLSMCRCLYRLHFHLLQLYEVYSKLVDGLVSATKPPQQVTDLSQPVCQLRDELVRAVAELAAQDHDLSPSQLDASNTSREDAEKLIMDCVNTKNYMQAVYHMRNLRPLFPGDMFGVHPSDETECLLFLFSRQQAEARPGIVIICRTLHDLSDVWSRLMDIKVLVSAQHPLTGHKSPVDQHDIGKAPDSSTL